MYYFNFKFHDIAITVYFTVFKRNMFSKFLQQSLKTMFFVSDLSVIS